MNSQRHRNAKHIRPSALALAIVAGLMAAAPLHAQQAAPPWLRS